MGDCLGAWCLKSVREVADRAFAFQVMQWFLVCTILQGLILVALLYSNVALLVYHRPTSARWLDTALIHAPMRFFFVLPFALLFPLCLFVKLGFAYTPPTPDGPQDYNKWHAWAGFGVVMGTNAVAFLVVLLRRDIVWCVAATWICVSIWSRRPKPGPVYITVIVFTVMHPLALLSSYIYWMFFSKKQGARVRLAGEDEHPGLYGNQQNRSQALGGGQYPARGPSGESVPREIGEETWG
ncbi:hypothetical protein CC2G_014961 [Coprinopsis cinerea AmutBmut pab1-1]|nr:hypothetical protein CC2G_014961 [Coprinopsis cinerea AmutBmut pab1-1]